MVVSDSLREAALARVYDGTTSLDEACAVAEGRMSPPSSRERRFRWSDATHDGTQRRGSLIAVDSAAIRSQLRRADITVLELADHGPAASGPS